MSLLKEYRTDDRQQPPSPPLPAELEDGSEWFQVERVCMHRDTRMGKKKNKIKRSYLIKWLGYGEGHNS